MNVFTDDKLFGVNICLCEYTQILLALIKFGFTPQIPNTRLTSRINTGTWTNKHQAWLEWDWNVKNGWAAPAVFAPKSGHSMASRALLPLAARDQSRPLKHEYATTAVSQSTRFSTLSAQQKSSFKNGHKDHCINHGGTKFSTSLSFTIILYPC